jgi:hypothetical protein
MGVCDIIGREISAIVLTNSVLPFNTQFLSDFDKSHSLAKGKLWSPVFFFGRIESVKSFVSN